MLCKTGFTRSELLCWQIDYAEGSLNVDGTIMRDIYSTDTGTVMNETVKADGGTTACFSPVAD